MAAVKASVVHSVKDQWKEFDLEGRRNEWDNQVSEITAKREECLDSRKRLAVTTKEFRTSHKADPNIKDVGLLLRSYQEEIDRLTQRGKLAEGAFLSLYTSLQSLADPCIALDAVIEDSKKAGQVSQLQIQNKQLEQELEKFRVEFQEMKNQEVTIRRLEEKVRSYEEEMAAMAQAQVALREKELRDEHAAELANAKDLERELSHQLQQTQRELRQIQDVDELSQTQHLQEKADFERELAAKQDEIDLYLDEVNRLSATNAELARDRQKALEEAEKVKLGGLEEAQHASAAVNLEIRLERKEEELSRLHDRLAEVENALESEREAEVQRADALKRELESIEAEKVLLKEELSSRPTQADVTHLQHQLQIFSSLEYDLSAEDLSTDQKQREAVEHVLKDRNKKLNAEVTRLKVFLQEREKELSALKGELASLHEAHKKKAELVEKLESDLVKGAAATRTSAVPGQPSMAAKSGSLAVAMSTPDLSASAPGQGSEAGADTMLKIVCGQRDRFQARAQLLEEKFDSLEKRTQTDKQELESLRADNIKLYQKIRYIESFQAGAVQRTPEDLEAGTNTVERKYAKLYEASVNPYARFKGKERAARYNELNAAEKVTISLGDFFLSYKFSRLFIFSYSILLHLFVFFIMYKAANTSTVVMEC